LIAQALILTMLTASNPSFRAKRGISLHVCLFALLLLPLLVSAQSPPKTLAERLGYPPDAKLLIVHADDLGVAHSVNAASVQALESGAINSASIMVPCPWFPEIADYAKAHPGADFGLHLTLTSERVYYRWGPVAPADQVHSLLDENGYFHQDWTPVTRIDLREAEIELRAQIDRAYAMGVRPTHLDSHQLRLDSTNKELFEVALRLAHHYKLPFFVTRDWFADFPYLAASLGPDDVVIDHTITMKPSVFLESNAEKAEDRDATIGKTEGRKLQNKRAENKNSTKVQKRWAAFYENALRNLQPGVTQLVIHLGFDDAELRAATRERPTWGAAWRQRDFDYFTSPAFRSLLQQQNIHLITWREIALAAPSIPRQ
jgi:chitin disaccharide deacetylase